MASVKPWTKNSPFCLAELLLGLLNLIAEVRFELGQLIQEGFVFVGCLHVILLVGF